MFLSPLTERSYPVGLTRPAELSQVPFLEEDLPLAKGSSSAQFPTGQVDRDMQQIDLRRTNSWLLQLHQVSTVELLETQLINAVAPFVLNARLKPLMAATPGVDKHIVNVSAMEVSAKYKTCCAFPSLKHRCACTSWWPTRCAFLAPRPSSFTRRGFLDRGVQQKADGSAVATARMWPQQPSFLYL